MTPPIQPPGWYPDPWGEGGQRYFDGTNWGPVAPAPDPPLSPPVQVRKEKPSRKKILWAIAGVVMFLGLVSTCSDDSKKSDTSSSQTTASQTSSPRITPPVSSSSAVAVPTTTTTPTGPEKPDALFTATQGPAGEEVTAVFTIHDNLTEGFIKTGARLETIKILEYARATYPNASQVNVQGSFPMTDAYGNTSTDVVINLTYLKSTLDRINFKGVDSDNIWELSDTTYIAPAFRP